MKYFQNPLKMKTGFLSQICTNYCQLSAQLPQRSQNSCKRLKIIPNRTNPASTQSVKSLVMRFEAGPSVLKPDVEAMGKHQLSPRNLLHLWYAMSFSGAHEFQTKRERDTNVQD